MFRIQQGQSATQIVGNDGTNPDGSRIVRKLGDVEPTFRMSFINRLSWGGFTLHALVDWQQGSDVINLTRFFYDLGGNTSDFVGAGQQRLKDFQAGFTRVFVESATFVKLREVTLSYEFRPESVTRYWSAAKRLRLSVSGRNLLTFTPYSGFDPEVSNFANQPIYRNIDVAPYPPSRTIWSSLDLSFY